MNLFFGLKDVNQIKSNQIPHVPDMTATQKQYKPNMDNHTAISLTPNTSTVHDPTHLGRLT